MLTLRAAAAMLAGADSLQAIRPIANAIGFPDSPLALTESGRLELGLSEAVSDACLHLGAGSLRLLTAVLAPDGTGDLRERTRRACTVLSRNAPTMDWCAIMIDRSRGALCIATVSPSPRGVRVAALRIDRERVVDSDAETLRALAAVTEPHGTLRHARFSDILRRDALSARFYRALRDSVAQLAASATGHAATGHAATGHAATGHAARGHAATGHADAERHELALLCASRCIFLAFLEAKGWLDGDRNFLLRHATTRLELGGHLHTRLLRPLFFGTLNTPARLRAPAACLFGDIPFLNGGLFSPTPLERRCRNLRFSDDALVALIGDLIDRYRFTAHEDSAAWSEAAVDPEMLGRAFESLMVEEERRLSGSFYTPPALVDQTVRDALAVALPALPAAFLDADPEARLDAKRGAAVLSQIAALRILDPACGSGAFLVHTLERLAVLQVQCGDEQSIDRLRRLTLTRSIFGVDRNPMAVWLCELRLWLSVVIECERAAPSDVPPLPNLDHHIRVGDSLAGGDFCYAPAGGRRVSQLRTRYTRATGTRKVALAQSLDQEERRQATAELERRIRAIQRERRELLTLARTRDLFGAHPPRTNARRDQLGGLRAGQRALATQHRRLAHGGALPFRFASHFADVASAGGFSLVIGNPPWVRPHALPPHERQAQRAEFQTVRHASWQTGAARAGAGAGFAAQADLSVAFVERAIALLAPAGTLAMLLPAKLWRTLSGGGVRQLLQTATDILQIRDWSDGPALFDAAVYPSLVVAQRCTLVTPHAAHNMTSADIRIRSETKANVRDLAPVKVAVSRGTRVDQFTVAASALSLGNDRSAPWILLPPSARTSFEALCSAGQALADSGLGRPTLGVKCGCNAAFLVSALEGDDDIATITAEGRRGNIERQLLRPVLRGEDIGRASHRSGATVMPNDEAARLIWTHGASGAALRALPPHAARWMSHWRRRLESRRDARGSQPWWTLFRTDAARTDTSRLVWADIGRRLRMQILPSGDPTVPLNSCYVLHTHSETDALALITLFTSDIADAWLHTLAEPARGGFRRFLGWTVASFPVPNAWASARIALAELGRRQLLGEALPPDETSTIVANAYGLCAEDLQPLLAWHTR